MKCLEMHGNDEQALGLNLVVIKTPKSEPCVSDLFIMCVHTCMKSLHL